MLSSRKQRLHRAEDGPHGNCLLLRHLRGGSAHRV